jgi:hypothetical protein
MSAFIAVGGAKKLENSPHPHVCSLEDTRTDANFCRMEIDLTKQVVKVTPWGSDETHVHDRVCVPEKIHACESSGASV